MGTAECILLKYYIVRNLRDVAMRQFLNIFLRKMKMNIVIFLCETIVKSVKLTICKTLFSKETHVYVMHL